MAALPCPFPAQRLGPCWKERAQGRVGLHPTAFAQDTAEAASTQWRAVADQIRPKVPKLATLMDDAEHDVLAYMSFPKEHRAKLHSTDEIDKTFVAFAAILSWCGRSRGEAWRAGWKRHRAAH